MRFENALFLLDHSEIWVTLRKKQICSVDQFSKLVFGLNEQPSHTINLTRTLISNIYVCICLWSVVPVIWESTKSCLCNELTLFKTCLQMIIVLPQLSSLGKYLPLLRAFQWGMTLYLEGFKNMTSISKKFKFDLSYFLYLLRYRENSTSSKSSQLW